MTSVLLIDPVDKRLVIVTSLRLFYSLYESYAASLVMAAILSVMK